MLCKPDDSQCNLVSIGRERVGLWAAGLSDFNSAP